MQDFLHYLHFQVSPDTLFMVASISFEFDIQDEWYCFLHDS